MQRSYYSITANMAEKWIRTTLYNDSTAGLYSKFYISFIIILNILIIFHLLNIGKKIKEALIERLGQNSIPFMIEIGAITPPSVQLLPAKRYTGAPIGTSYDIRVYTGIPDFQKYWSCHIFYAQKILSLILIILITILNI